MAAKIAAKHGSSAAAAAAGSNRMKWRRKLAWHGGNGIEITA
jgi:hypothetical protein